MEKQLVSETVEKLREAESLIGSPATQMFMDRMNPNCRKDWLRSVRKILSACEVKPENLPGPWHTEEESHARSSD